MLSRIIAALPPLHPLLELRLHDYDGAHYITWANTGPGALCSWVEMLHDYQWQLREFTAQLIERRTTGRRGTPHELTRRELESLVKESQRDVDRARRWAVATAQRLTSDELATVREHAPASVRLFARQNHPTLTP